jgi:anti-anti-sigma factor
MRACEGQLVLVSPSAAVQRALSLMRLEEFFTRVPDVASAIRLLKTVSEKPAVTLSDGSCGSLVEWHGEITAANADEVWQETVSSLMLENPHELDKGPNALTLDLADVRFIDSSGLGLMIRIKKLANQNAIRLFFDNVQPAVCNVIHLARLEAFLFGEKESAAAKV